MRTCIVLFVCFLITNNYASKITDCGLLPRTFWIGCQQEVRRLCIHTELLLFATYLFVYANASHDAFLKNWPYKSSIIMYHNHPTSTMTELHLAQSGGCKFVRRHLQGGILCMQMTWQSLEFHFIGTKMKIYACCAVAPCTSILI